MQGNLLHHPIVVLRFGPQNLLHTFSLVLTKIKNFTAIYFNKPTGKVNNIILAAKGANGVESYAY
jgi:hypothetical protein